MVFCLQYVHKATFTAYGDDSPAVDKSKND